MLILMKIMLILMMMMMMNHKAEEESPLPSPRQHQNPEAIHQDHHHDHHRHLHHHHHHHHLISPCEHQNGLFPIHLVHYNLAQINNWFKSVQHLLNYSSSSLTQDSDHFFLHLHHHHSLKIEHTNIIINTRGQSADEVEHSGRPRQSPSPPSSSCLPR